MGDPLLYQEYGKYIGTCTMVRSAIKAEFLYSQNLEDVEFQLGKYIWPQMIINEILLSAH